MDFICSILNHAEICHFISAHLVISLKNNVYRFTVAVNL